MLGYNVWSQAAFLCATRKDRHSGMSVRIVSISHSSVLDVHLKNIVLSVTVAYNAGCVA